VLLGEGAVVGRLGGDEFAALVGQDDEVAVLGQAHVLRAGLRPAVDVGAAEVRVSVSVGAAVQVYGFGADDLMRRADAALYTAKRGSGVALHGDGPVVVDGVPPSFVGLTRRPAFRRARGRRRR
jgi:diguanylate cyclase (GGDEF)-like protein